MIHLCECNLPAWPFPGMQVIHKCICWLQLNNMVALTLCKDQKQSLCFSTLFLFSYRIRRCISWLWCTLNAKYLLWWLRLSLYSFLFSSLSSTTSSVGSLHHHQGLSTPRCAESGLSVPLPALHGTETPDAQHGGRQGAPSVYPLISITQRTVHLSFQEQAASWVADTASHSNLSRKRYLFPPAR